MMGGMIDRWNSKSDKQIIEEQVCIRYHRERWLIRDKSVELRKWFGDRTLALQV